MALAPIPTQPLPRRNLVEVPAAPQQMIRPLYLRVWGPRACFARPEFPTERVSYPCMTPSAARGLLSSIYFKPEFNWQVRQIRILNPIKRFNETRNEITEYATKTNLKVSTVSDENRFQRHTQGLADVAYVIVAEAVPVPYTAEDVKKHAEIFEKMTRTGQCKARPYFGAREWACYFEWSDGTEPTQKIDIDVGPMTFDFNYSKWSGPTPRVNDGAGSAPNDTEMHGPDDHRITAAHQNNVRTVPVKFRAKIVNGVLHVPAELYRYAGGCRGHERLQPELPPAADV